MITGTVDNNSVVSTDLSGVLDGRLSFKSDVKLDHEAKAQYRVIITATDPSNDKDTVEVIVTITNVNESPYWVKAKSPGQVTHAENDKSAVAIYDADDPEGSGVTYSLVTAGVPNPDGDGTTSDDIVADDIADRAQFKIHSTNGTLEFRSPPNYEDPKDEGANDNKYKVTVAAKAADTTTPVGGIPTFTVYREVTVTVTNENEAPMFLKDTESLRILENPDDPEKEGTSTQDAEYLLNRGVGIPGANRPAVPNLDVGIPVVALDDDNTRTAVNYIGTNPAAARPSGRQPRLGPADRRPDLQVGGFGGSPEDLPYSPGHRSDPDPEKAEPRGDW